MQYRLSLDVGTNSLGWWIWQLDADGQVVDALDGGVRVYSDGRNPKDKTSLATNRRMARGQRRNRDRALNRKTRLMHELRALGLMPADADARKEMEGRDPYFLRRKALDSPLRPFEMGRALLHLNQRRGFRSNRKAVDAEKTGKVLDDITQLDLAMQDSKARTLGEFLHQRRKDGLPARSKADVGLYAARKHYADEFAAIRAVQSPHQMLTDADWDKLHRTIFHQRDLKPVDPGRCTLLPHEQRAASARPLSQWFRILQEIDNLVLLSPMGEDRRLAQDERVAVAELCFGQGRVTFDALRQKLGVGDSTKFNLESDRRTALKGDETAACLAKKKHFGPRWWQFTPARQDEIVEMLLDDQKSDDEIRRLAIQDWGLSEAAANAILGADLPRGYGRLSCEAMRRIVDGMESGLSSYEAKAAAFPEQHSHGEGARRQLLPKLPHYPEAPGLERYLDGGSAAGDDVFDRIGRISNPTVHVGLNQVRRLVNAVMDEYGRPASVVVELGRDLKNSQSERKAIEKRQRDAMKEKARREKTIISTGHTPTPDLLRKMRLWEEQGPVTSRHCPYCLRQIGMGMLIRGEVEVDHILPFSRTLDDSMANKVVCCRSCNRVKNNRSPAEAYSSSDLYPKIMQSANDLPRNKRWRFQLNAMERFQSDERDFLDRQLNETRYLARVTKTYLEAICPNVYVTPGRLTALLRRAWGLNGTLGKGRGGKNRDDHRHHALDAAVIGLIDRGMLQAVSAASGQGVGGRLLENVPRPPKCPHLRERVEQVLQNMTVWHKPDHITPGRISGTSGALHNDTAYGVVTGPDQDGRHVVVHRKLLKDLKSHADIGKVANDDLKNRILQVWSAEKSSNPNCKWGDFADKAAQPGVLTASGVKSVRVHEKMSGLIPIRNREGKVYKAYKPDGNAFMDIVRLPDGKWKAETVTVFDANQKGFVPQWRNDCGKDALVMRLHVNDVVAIGTGPERRILRVVKMSRQNIVCADVCEGGSLKQRHKDAGDMFKYVVRAVNAMRKMGLRRVGINDLGHISDPGPIK